MNNPVKISVIIPSLNANEYIDDAIASVLRQTLKDIEVICVDAGSTDGTLDTIKKHADADDRVVLLMSEIKSYGHQMNMGIDHARGEYIGIVEADDYAPEEMYKDLYEIASDKRLDIIKADFYRFTGAGDDMVKIYFPLTDRHDLYGRVYDPGKEQRSLLTTNNTWSGIYRREFLIENGIRHNETPGASFQDNGFYFQTMMYAKRVLFLNKPYYMNRRDNPGSSVFDRRKTYCICDEYKFIYDKLKASGLYPKYQDVFNERLFMEYFGNLSRIGSRVKREYFRRFAEDFRKLKEQRELDLSVFEEYRANTLNSIMSDPDRYWDKYIRPFDEVYDEVEKYDQIIIYGAASVGYQAMHTLLGRGKSKNILCFAVTRPKPGVDSVYGYGIKAIDKLTEYSSGAALLIASKKQYQPDMKKTAEELGFRNIFTVPFIEE